MTTRERILATTFLLVVVAAGGAFLFKQLFLDRLTTRQNAVDKLRKDIQDKELYIAQVLKDRQRLERMQLLSLPQDPDLARREYEKYLGEVLRKSGFAAGSFRINSEQPDANSSPKLRGRKDPIYLSLPFTVQAQGDLASLVEAMEHFYKTGLLHRIKSFSIQRPLTTGPNQRPGDLDINLTVEALVVSGAPNRTYLLPNIDRRLLVADLLTGMRRGPIGLALVPWAVGPTGPLGPNNLAGGKRRYAAIAGKNIFHGPPPPVVRQERQEEVDSSRFTRLVDITWDERGAQGFLFDVYNNKTLRLRPRRGFNTFALIRDDEQRTVVQGTVVHMNSRDVIIAVELKADNLMELGSEEELTGFYALKELSEGFWKELERRRRTPAGIQLPEAFWAKWKDEKAIRPAERSTAVLADRGYWDDLIDARKVQTEGSSVTFLLNRLGILHGKIFYKDDGYVCLVVERPHYAIHVGQTLEEALRRPLRGEELESHGVVAVTAEPGQ